MEFRQPGEHSVGNPSSENGVGTLSTVVQIDPCESECLEIRFLHDPSEVVVLRHGMSYPEGGEAVYSELIDPC